MFRRDVDSFLSRRIEETGNDDGDATNTDGGGEATTDGGSQPKPKKGPEESDPHRGRRHQKVHLHKSEQYRGASGAGGVLSRVT